MFKSPLQRAPVPARRNALLTCLGQNLPKQSCWFFLCLCQSLYLGVRLKLRCKVSAYILPIELFLTTVNVLGTCSQTAGNNRPHPSLRVPLSPSLLWGSRLGTPTISMLWNQEGNMLQSGRRKFTTPPWHWWLPSSTYEGWMERSDILFPQQCVPLTYGQYSVTFFRPIQFFFLICQTFNWSEIEC